MKDRRLGIKIYDLRFDAQDEVYLLIDKKYKALPKNPDGTFNLTSKDVDDNEIDALRHSYVSGIYIMEYNEALADLLGRLNELTSSAIGPTRAVSENMDLWNNSIGRYYAKKAMGKFDFFDLLLKALKSGELILDLKDPRKYKGGKSIKRLPKSFVIKIQESKTGANIQFYDVHRKMIMSKEEFIQNIRKGRYPGYAVRKHLEGEFPYSTRDRFSFNNLG